MDIVFQLLKVNPVFANVPEFPRTVTVAPDTYGEELSTGTEPLVLPLPSYATVYLGRAVHWANSIVLVVIVNVLVGE